MSHHFAAVRAVLVNNRHQDDDEAHQADKREGGITPRWDSQ
jgi:hypothetical protein